MRKSFLGLFFLLALFFAGVGDVRACSCMGRSQGVKGVQTCSYYWYSEAVFTGVAENITIENGRMRVTFAVEKPIRGVNEKTVDVFTSASGASCGYPFKQGERYFVYARKSSSGQLGESLCGPTTLLKDADDDLKYVAELESGKLGTRIFGTVSEDRQVNYGDKRTFEKLAGIEITAKKENGKKSIFRTTTDENGFYIFKDIPPDIYRLTAKFPNGWREIDTTGNQLHHIAVIYKEPVRCDEESFLVTRQGSIRGKVIDQDGKNPIQQILSLFPFNDEGKVLHDIRNWPAEKWANKENGEFFFNIVPAGKYLLVINPKNCPYPTNGFPTMYFPGVADKSDARIITVKEGENLTLENFSILPMLKERWFSGVVLYADKTPASNVTVKLRDGNSGKCDNFNSEVTTNEFGGFLLKGYETYSYTIKAYTEVRSQDQPNSKLHSKTVELPETGNIKNIELIADLVY